MSANFGSFLLAVSPLLAPFGGTWGCFQVICCRFLYVENGKDVFLHGGNKSSLLRSENFSTPVLFLLPDGAVRESV